MEYNTKHNNCDNTDKFEVIQDEVGQTYLILAVYKDKYFAKKCTVLEDIHGILINSAKYKLIDIGDGEVTMYNYEKYAKNCYLLN